MKIADLQDEIRYLKGKLDEQRKVMARNTARLRQLLIRVQELKGEVNDLD